MMTRARGKTGKRKSTVVSGSSSELEGIPDEERLKTIAEVSTSSEKLCLEFWKISVPTLTFIDKKFRDS